MSGLNPNVRRMYEWTIIVRDPLTGDLLIMKRSNRTFDSWIECYMNAEANRDDVKVRRRVMREPLDPMSRVYSWRMTAHDRHTNDSLIDERSDTTFDSLEECYRDAEAYRNEHPVAANDVVEILEKTHCSCGRLAMKMSIQILGYLGGWCRL